MAARQLARDQRVEAVDLRPLDVEHEVVGALLRQVAQATLARLDSVALDGLIIYDVDAESDRSPDARPFPFMPMMDPAHFLDRHLSGWTRPVVVYRPSASTPR